MAEHKRFKSQDLDSNDYAKTEEGAKLLKDGGKILTVGAFLVVVAKKYGPRVLKSITKLRKP